MRHALKQWIEEKQANGVWSDKTAQHMHYWGKHFALFFKKRYSLHSLSKLKPYHIDTYRKEYLAFLSPWSQYDEYKIIRSFLNWCMDYGLLLSSPIAHWQISGAPKSLPRYLSKEQIQTILNSIDTGTPFGIEQKTIVEMLYATGIRRAELIALDFPDVDISTARIWIHHGKGDKGRIVPIVSSCIRWLKYYLKEARPCLLAGNSCDAFFLNKEGGRISIKNIDFLMKNLRESTKIQGITAHVFRHSCATHLMEQGVPIFYIQALLGHSTVDTTQRYLHLLSHEVQKNYDLAHPRDEWEIPSEKR